MKQRWSTSSAIDAVIFTVSSNDSLKKR